MRKNASLHAAKKAKNDEFYTQYKDIEAELSHYTESFKNKTVYCNCDDPSFSNFWKYFHVNFSNLMLKKLISTYYNADGVSYKTEYAGGDDANVHAWDRTELTQNGDFRSEECINILKESDICCSNPPFSLFREYVTQLIEYKKQFLIIGNMNAITYKEVFPLIKDNQIWLGYGFNHGDAYFRVPADTANQYAAGVYNPDTELVHFRNCAWFTNLDHKKRHEPLDLRGNYYHGNEEKYPKYDNYDAINVDKVDDIPCDYDGVMGVPITFLDKYCPEQFEIVSFRKGEDGKDLVFKKKKRESSTVLSYPCTTAIPGMIKNAEGKIGGRNTYARITIRRISNQ